MPDQVKKIDVDDLVDGSVLSSENFKTKYIVMRTEKGGTRGYFKLPHNFCGKMDQKLLDDLISQGYTLGDYVSSSICVGEAVSKSLFVMHIDDSIFPGRFNTVSDVMRKYPIAPEGAHISKLFSEDRSKTIEVWLDLKRSDKLYFLRHFKYCPKENWTPS